MSPGGEPRPGDGGERAASGATGVACQLEAFPARLDTGAPSREEPWTWYLKRRAQGVLIRLRREWRRLRGRPAAAPDPRPATAWPAADVQAGDWVRVRPAEYVRATLDERGMLKGCGFGLGQYQYCGRTLRVIKLVEHFFDEGQARMLRARHMVLLDGVHCDGASSRFTRGCDRMCFYFWRTEWLEKVDPPEPALFTKASAAAHETAPAPGVLTGPRDDA